MNETARILIFDIEATALNASFGHVLAFGYKYLGDPDATVLSIEQFRAKRGEEPDARLLRRIHKMLTKEADIIVSFYGKEYDRKFLNTRMMIVGLPILPPLSSEHVDLYFTARGNLRLHSGRLQAVSETLGCPWSKSPVRADVWRQAMRGNKEALAYVVEHCRLDVQILEWAYLKLRSVVRQHPPVSDRPDACRVCGAVDWQSNGTRFRMGTKHRRFQCGGCGAWVYKNMKGNQVAA